MGKSQTIINSSMSSIQGALNNLNEAMASCEKQENKNVLQSAIDSINCACDHLSKFQD